jgi:DNA-directed RNA polymerase specialized sigma24 family protein
VDFALATELAVEDFAEDNPAAAYALQLQAEGYSIREIAEKIGRAEPATTTYLHMCRKKLRHYLDK